LSILSACWGVLVRTAATYWLTTAKRATILELSGFKIGSYLLPPPRQGQPSRSGAMRTFRLRWNDKPCRLQGLVVVCLLAAAAGCGKHGKAAPVGGSDVAPSKVNLKRNVELTQAEQRPLVYYVETVGVLEAEGQTDIAAGVNGVVDEVLF